MFYISYGKIILIRTFLQQIINQFHAFKSETMSMLLNQIRVNGKKNKRRRNEFIKNNKTSSQLKILKKLLNFLLNTLLKIKFNQNVIQSIIMIILIKIKIYCTFVFLQFIFVILNFLISYSIFKFHSCDL